MEQKMSKKDFWENAVSAKIKTGIKSAATAAFFSATITFIAAFVIDQSMILDAFLSLVLGLGILFKRSRLCACVLTIYFIISKIALMFYGFKPTSLLTAIAFIIFYVNGIKYTFQYQKLWKSYLKGDIIPADINKVDMNKIHEFLETQNQGTEGIFEAQKEDN